MPTLDIKNPRVYELARQASDATGASMTSVIELALEKLLAELSRPRPGAAARLQALARTSGPLLRDLPPDPFGELYDERTGAPPVILDSSAVIAILRDEPEGPELAELIERASTVRMSGATALECAIVLGPSLDHLLDRFLEAADAQLEPVTVGQVSLARAAHRTYGRGSGHPARLNFGDCFAYALARERDKPLLFTGDDFSRTDVRHAG